MPRGQPQGEEIYRPEVSAEDLPRKHVPEMRESPLAQGGEGFGQAITAKFQADSAAWAGDQIAQGRIKAVQNLEAAKSALPEGQDPGNFTERSLASFDKDITPL